jgi:FlaA1/EpsC-like NDP-sugar epimerase
MKSLVDKFTPRQRKIILVGVDAVTTLLTLFLALSLTMGTATAIELLTDNSWLVPLFLLTRIGTYYNMGLYFFLWRYASVKELLTIVKAVSFGSLAITTCIFMVNTMPFFKSILFIDWMFSLVAVGGARFGLRFYRDYLVKKSKEKQTRSKKNILIIGAGDAGEMIAREINKVSSLDYQLVGYVDDKKNKIGQIIHQSPVLGTTDSIPEICAKYQVDEAILAIPSATGNFRRKVITSCKNANIKCKTTPGLFEILNGKVNLNQLREVRIGDLLGREAIETDLSSITKYLSNATIVVTGAGGSIGSELCRQILQFSPKKLVLIDNGETPMYHVHSEIITKNDSTAVIEPVVADIKCKDRLDRIFTQHKPDIIFHAAAFKHVPLMESNVEEVIQNNIKGTQNLLTLADTHKVKEFVLISTDKAVNPINCMGLSKRICEILMQVQAQSSETKFTAVRFGNVLGSQGSVVPLFKKQIKEGGPITVTHKDMTRYFMTIQEAVGLVIQAGALSEGGEIFILDMGDPVNIVNLAKDLIRLSGLEESKDIEIKFTGIRPGEKIVEELYFDKSCLKSTTHKKIFITTPTSFQANEIADRVLRLYKSCETKPSDALKKDMNAIVEICQPSSPLVEIKEKVVA